MKASATIFIEWSRELGLTFRRVADTDGLQLLGFCDADWASDVDDRRSTTGFAFWIQEEGGSDQVELNEATHSCHYVFST